MSELMRTKEYLIQAVASVINNTPCEALPDDISAQRVYTFAKNNCVQTMLYFAFKGLEINDLQTLARLEKSYQAAAVRETLQQTELEAVREEFSAEKIDFMLLKGAHLKSLYPIPEMRFMVDMDILVKKEDVHRAKEILVSHGFEQKMNNGKDIALMKPPLLNIELHNSLFEEDYYLFDHFFSVWDKAKQAYAHEYCMTQSDLYVYSIAHLAEHYTAGGSCFRPVVDIYLLGKKCSDELDFDYINSELTALGLDEFAANIKQLGKCWFEGAPKDKTLELMENYIVLGPPVQNAAAAAPGEEQNGRFKILRAAFPSVKHMKRLYPVLEKAVFLLPIFWIVRAFTYVFRKDMRKRLSQLNSVSKKDDEVMNKIYNASGLGNTQK